MAMAIEFPEPRGFEPSNEQLAAAEAIDWYTPGNMCALMARGFGVDFERTKQVVDTLTSFTDYGAGVYAVAHPAAGPKILTDVGDEADTYSRLALALQEAKAIHVFPDEPPETSEKAASRLQGMNGAVDLSSDDKSLASVRLSFLADAMRTLSGMPGTVLPKDLIPMWYAVRPPARERWGMRSQLHPFKRTIDSLRGDQKIYFYPDTEISNALSVSGELWHSGLAKLTGSIMHNLVLFRPDAPATIPESPNYFKNIGRALAFGALEVHRLRLEAEQEKQYHEAICQGAQPHPATVPRARYYFS